MNTKNDITNDHITNALKGDKEKYREGWEAIFGKKDMKKHVQQITGDTPHDVVDTFLVRYNTEYIKEELLDEITRMGDRMPKDSDIDMGLYDNDD